MVNRCELLDFDLYGEKISGDEILAKLNDSLVAGVRVLSVYDDGRKIKHLSYLDCNIVLEYDNAIPNGAAAQIQQLFAQSEVLVQKKSKNGTIADQNIIPMIQSLKVQEQGSEITIRALVCCQNPSLNPMQIYTAVCKYLPDLTPAFVRCERLEVYDLEKNIFR